MPSDEGRRAIHLAGRGIDKVVRQGRFGATMVSHDEIEAMAELLVAFGVAPRGPSLTVDDPITAIEPLSAPDHQTQPEDET